LWNEGDNSGAENRFRRAEKLLLSVPPDQRDAAENVDITLGKINLNWGGMLHLSKRYEDAIARSDTGLKSIEPYLRVEPNDADARDVCLTLQGNRGNALAVLGRRRESADDWTPPIFAAA